MFILTLFLIMVLLGKTSPSGPYDNQALIKAVLDSYDIAKPFNENFFSILHLICPQSLHCEGENDRELNFAYLKDHINDTFELSHGLPQDRNESLIKEARSYLKAALNEMQNCCQKCYCTEDCRTRNICCPLMETVDKIDEQTSKQSCIYPTIYDTDLLTETRDEHFLMTTDCLHTSADEDVTRKCKYPNITFPDEMVPVYSKSSDRIYRNKYCAQCNNEVMLVSWQLNVKFANIFSLLGRIKIPDSLEKLYQTALNSRRFIVEVSIDVPNEIAERKSDFICFQSISDSACDDNQNSDKYQDYFMQYACSYYQATYRNLYKNPFCFMCSVAGQSVRYTGCLPHPTRVSFNGFSALLRQHDYEQADNAKGLVPKGNPCGCAEYFDQQNGTCRQLFCPPMKSYFDCSCEAYIANMTGLMVKVFLDVHPMTTSRHVMELFNSTSRDVLVRKVESSISNFFRKQWGPMEICYIFMYRETSLSDSSHLKFHILVAIRSKLATDNMLLMNNIYGRLYSGFKATILNIPISISLGKIVNTFMNKGKLEGIYASDENNDLAFMSLHSAADKNAGCKTNEVSPMYLTYYQVLSKRMFCKTITLYAEELSMLANVSLATSYRPDDVAYAFEESTQRICFDDFLKIYRPSSVAFQICQSYSRMLSATVLFHVLLMYCI